jgi:hypothetical protein
MSNNATLEPTARPIIAPVDSVLEDFPKDWLPVASVIVVSSGGVVELLNALRPAAITSNSPLLSGR